MISVLAIQVTVARQYGHSVRDLKSERRDEPLTWHRHVAMWLARELTGLSLPQIGRSFGRDHSTVTSAVRRVDRGREVDASILRETDALRSDLAARHMPEALEAAAEPLIALAEDLLTKEPADRCLSGQQLGQLCGEVLRLRQELAFTRSLIPEIQPQQETTNETS